MFINEYDEVPLDAVTYLTGQCNYGGRVTDDWDRRCLLNILSNFYTPAITTDPKYKFSTSGKYHTPPKGSHEDYVEFIKVQYGELYWAQVTKSLLSLQELPMTQHPEVFGMDDNVDISKELQETKQVGHRKIVLKLMLDDLPFLLLSQLFDSILLTQSQSKGGKGGKTEDTLNEIAADILSKVHRSFPEACS